MGEVKRTVKDVVSDIINELKFMVDVDWTSADGYYLSLEIFAPKSLERGWFDKKTAGGSCAENSFVLGSVVLVDASTGRVGEDLFQMLNSLKNAELNGNRDRVYESYGIDSLDDIDLFFDRIYEDGEFRAEQRSDCDLEDNLYVLNNSADIMWFAMNFGGLLAEYQSLVPKDKRGQTEIYYQEGGYNDSEILTEDEILSRVCSKYGLSRKKGNLCSWVIIKMG